MIQTGSKHLRYLVAFLLVVLATGCSNQGSQSGSSSSSPPAFTILSGSENKDLEPIINQFAADRHTTIKMTYAGSVDMMLRLRDQSVEADAVWPANSIWIDLGDSHKLVKQQQSIMRTPVVFGVKKSVAQRLGWVGKPVKVNDVLKAAEAGNLHYMMTSATQSNSGASAYLGYLYAFAGRPEVLTDKNLHDPQVRAKVKRILSTVNRSAGSSGWLKDLFISKYDQFDGMVNYESLIIQANRELVASNREPLYVVYPEDGLAIADSPFGYIDRNDPAKQKLFSDLQSYLLSQPVQNQIMATGRRVGLVGLELPNADPAVFNPDWGIDTKRVISPIKFPNADVIREALNLYQSAFRKPSFTVYCLDYSGSMEGEGEQQLKAAMAALLNKDQAANSLLQASPNDVTIVVPFNGSVIDTWEADGDDSAKLAAVLQKVQGLSPNGGTDIYTPVMRAIDLMKQHGNIENYSPAVILMTDGKSNDNKLGQLRDYIGQAHLGMDVPVYGVMFGEADPSDLNEVATSTSGKVFDGRTDLASAFREVKGYN